MFSPRWLPWPRPEATFTPWLEISVTRYFLSLDFFLVCSVLSRYFPHAACYTENIEVFTPQVITNIPEDFRISIAGS